MNSKLNTASSKIIFLSVIIEWSKLSHEIQDDANLNVFKKIFKKVDKTGREQHINKSTRA